MVLYCKYNQIITTKIAKLKRMQILVSEFKKITHHHDIDVLKNLPTRGANKYPNPCIANTIAMVRPRVAGSVAPSAASVALSGYSPPIPKPSIVRNRPSVKYIYL
jgi:hypothetical protein